MNKIERHIEVYADWCELPQPELIGYLHATLLRGKEIFSFEYDTRWLKKDVLFTLDPELHSFQGRLYPSEKKNNFGVFLDSSPDRWGRFLMKRREAQLAREEKRQERQLTESDYLLGVYDEHRIGALRFKTEKTGAFLDNNKTLTAPPWTSLRELEQASLQIEKPDAEKQENYSHWLNMLIAPGGSLGGARPKASVIDERNHLWIAKFPSNQDEYDVAAWEMLVNILAKKAGVTTAEAQLKKLNNHYHTFLTKRFDRTNTGERIHFASGMTLLQRTDGDDASTGASYLELAEFIIQQGAKPTEDLEQLWRRIVFYICVSNVDDHLRNHGFIFAPKHGWILSPAFDMNPNPSGEGLKLNISESDNAQDFALAREVADYFQLGSTQADSIIAHTIKTVRTWRHEAAILGLSANAQHQMARAFRLCD